MKLMLSQIHGVIIASESIEVAASIVGCAADVLKDHLAKYTYQQRVLTFSMMKEIELDDALGIFKEFYTMEATIDIIPRSQKSQPIPRLSTAPVLSALPALPALRTRAEVLEERARQIRAAKRNLDTNGPSEVFQPPKRARGPVVRRSKLSDTSPMQMLPHLSFHARTPNMFDPELTSVAGFDGGCAQQSYVFNSPSPAATVDQFYDSSSLILPSSDFSTFLDDASKSAGVVNHSEDGQNDPMIALGGGHEQRIKPSVSEMGMFTTVGSEFAPSMIIDLSSEGNKIP
jgi:hypothetical protein